MTSRSLPSDPILQSLHAETCRLYASNVTVRVVTSPEYKLDDKYTIRKGTTLFIYTKLTGQYAKGWTEARPQATSKPLSTFWAERFLVSRDNKGERFSDFGFGGSWTSFGGGEHKCPGRHFARNIGVITLAALLGDYECHLVDIPAAQGVTPNLKETAFGKEVPTSAVAARIRKTTEIRSPSSKRTIRISCDLKYPYVQHDICNMSHALAPPLYKGASLMSFTFCPFNNQRLRI